MNKYKKLLSNSILFSIGSLGSKVILFFLVPLYTNILTTAEYGIADLITTTANLLMPFLTLSINDSIMRYALDKNKEKGEVLWNALIVLTISSIILVAAYPIVRWTGIFGEYSSLFVLFTVLYQFRSSFSVYLQGSERINIYVIDGLLYTVLLATFNILFLVVMRQGLYGYIKALIFSVAFSICFQLFAGKLVNDLRIAYHWNTPLLKEMVQYSVPLIASGVSWWIVTYSDRYMLKLMVGDDAVGIYAVAAKMPALVSTFTSIISQAWLISSIKEYETDKNKNFFSNVFSAYFIFLLIAISGVIIIIKPFMKIYVGENFVSAWIYVPCLLGSTLAKAVANYFMTFYKAEKKNIRELSVTSMGALINIVLNYILISYYGIMGAAISTLISMSLMAIISILDTRRFFRFSLNAKIKFVSIMIALFQIIVVSNNYHPIIVSIFCFCVLVIINIESLKEIATDVFGEK